VLFPGLLLNCTTVTLKVSMLTLRAMDSMFSESFVNPNDASSNLLFDCSIQHLLIHSACVIRCGKYISPFMFMYSFYCFSFRWCMIFTKLSQRFYEHAAKACVKKLPSELELLVVLL